MSVHRLFVGSKAYLDVIQLIQADVQRSERLRTSTRGRKNICEFFLMSLFILLRAVCATVKNSLQRYLPRAYNTNPPDC